MHFTEFIHQKALNISFKELFTVYRNRYSSIVDEYSVITILIGMHNNPAISIISYDPDLFML